jgi:steroid delta-isomerase-like uncharacterized protein
MAIPQLDAAWNARSGSAVARAFVPDGVRVEYALPGARLEGREAIAAHIEAYVCAVPDCRLEIRGVTEHDGVAVVEWTLCGTHTGDLPGLPAQGEEVALDGVSVCAMEGELIREERVYWDAATLLAGAGVLAG